MINRSVNRRHLLTGSAALAATATLPLSGCASRLASKSQASDGTLSMRTHRIPGTDEFLPVVGLGSPLEFIKMPASGKQLPKALIQSMVDRGGRVMDTPAFFRPDVPIVGDVIKEMELQDELFLISKITIDGKQEGIAHLEKAVANLGKRPIDALLVHNMRQLDVHWPTLKDWKAAGKVRYIGVSLTRQTDYRPLMQFMKKEQPDLVMTGYSITQQGPAKEVFPLARDIGAGIIGVEPFKAFDDGAFFSVVAGRPLPEWAAEFDCQSWAQFSLKYILSDPAVTCVVTETGKTKHVIDNMGAGYGRLPDPKLRRRMSDYLLSL